MGQHDSIPEGGRSKPDSDDLHLLAKYPLRFLGPGDNPKEKFARLWENISQFAMLFDDATWKRFDLFMFLVSRQGKDAIIYEVGDVGLVWLMNVQRGAGADLFLAFWGPCPHDDKLALLKVLGRDAFHRFSLKRVGMACYAENEKVIKMCEEAGAHRDGVMRKARRLMGEMRDLVVYSILREEFFVWEGRQPWNPALVEMPVAPPKPTEEAN